MTTFPTNIRRHILLSKKGSLMYSRSLIVLFILCIWFVVSFVSNILAPMMPIIIKDFDLSLGMAGFLPFSFFIAYGIVSIPAGIMIEKFGPKYMLTVAFLFNLAGALTLGLMPVYGVVITALFVIGMGMAMLQVIINPLMRTAGGEEHYAFFSVMGQLVFGLASFVSPFAFAALMAQANSGTSESGVISMLLDLAPLELPWVSFYFAFAIIFIIVLLVTRFIKIPDIELKSDERSESLSVYRDLLKRREVILFALGIVAYVGAEASLANWMSQFLQTYHGISPTGEGAEAVGMFWGLMSVGCLVGLVLLKLVDSKIVLRIFSILAILSVAAALFGDARLSLIAFPACGFFLSVMWSIIFSLALNSVPQHHGAFSGILCSGILGGAIMPLIVGLIGDVVGLKIALLVIFGLLGYIFSISYWANPIIQNQTFKMAGRQKQNS